MQKKTIRDKQEHYTDEMNQKQVLCDRPHLCTPYGVKFTYFDQK
jgi:hypothetical protein